MRGSLSIVLKRFVFNGSRSTNPAMQFPCLDKLDELTAQLRKQTTNTLTHNSCTVKDLTFSSNNEPTYGKVQSGYKLFESNRPLFLDYGGILPNFKIHRQSNIGEKQTAVLFSQSTNRYFWFERENKIKFLNDTIG